MERHNFVCRVCVRDDIWIRKGRCAGNDETTGHTNTETLEYKPA
jgi:hypothetical protein